MSKKAFIVITLVSESEKVSNERIEMEIRKSLKCDWLKEVEKVKVE